MKNKGQNQKKIGDRMKKFFGIVLMLGIGLFVVAGCGKSTTSEKKLSKSDNVFENGKTFKIRNSDEQNYYFEVESKSKGILSVYDLENDKKEYQIPYKIEKQENGNILYKFNGKSINDYPLFNPKNGKYHYRDETENNKESSDYYLPKIDGKYYFIMPKFIGEESIKSKKTIEKLKSEHLNKYSTEIME